MPRGDVPGSRAERLANEVEAEILTRDLAEGTRLGLRTELIERFGVSPGVMNEVLRLLRERGLVTVKSGPKGGVYVAEPPPRISLGAVDIWFQNPSVDVADLFESRMFLQELFMALSIERAGPDDITAAEWALEDMRKLREDPYGFSRAALRFSLAFARASRLGTLASLHEAIIAVINGGIVRVSFVEDHKRLVDRTIAVHAEVLDAIRAQEPQRLHDALIAIRHDIVPYGGRTRQAPSSAVSLRGRPAGSRRDAEAPDTRPEAGSRAR